MLWNSLKTGSDRDSSTPGSRSEDLCTSSAGIHESLIELLDALGELVDLLLRFLAKSGVLGAQLLGRLRTRYPLACLSNSNALHTPMHREAIRPFITRCFFSNEIGSNATSAGAYRTGAEYIGKYGASMRLDGLDPDNSNAYARAIVIHPAWYVSDDMIRKYGKLGRSQGCFAFSDEDRTEVVSRLGEGRLLYAGKF